MQEIIFINEKMLKYSLRLVSVSAKSIFMSKNYKIFATVLIGAVLSGCAVHSPIVEKEQAASIQEQEIAQETVVSATTTPVLKRKLALGRITNETSYGKSLLRNDDGDPLGKQVADIFAKALRQSNQFTVLERTDISSLEKESALTGKAFKAVGADVLIIGSLSEFGRKTEGKSGFFSVAKKQVAYAKMDVRLVDTRNGVVIAAFSGTGEATNVQNAVLGYGSHATYDGTLNDKAISAAVNDVVSKLVSKLSARPWNTSFLSLDPKMTVISGGASQGIVPGMEFVVKTAGKVVTSKQTGFDVQLPGEKIARIKVMSTFGDTPESEGAIVQVIEGNLRGMDICQAQC